MRHLVPAILLLMLSLSALALEPGEQAVDFRLLDTRGQTVNIASMRGKLVVLEWWNPDCPPDMAYYDPPYQQKLQERYTALGVEWLLISSSAHGIGGKMTAQRANQWRHNHGAKPTHIVLDSTQKVARDYGVEATPTVFLLGKDGKVIYRGAVDDGDQEEYLKQALDDALADKPISKPRTRPFGCGIR